MIIRPNLPSHGAHQGTGHTLISFSSLFLPFFFSLSRARARALILFHPLTVPASGWKLGSGSDRPQAGSRGKNASLLIIQYARDAPGESEGTDPWLPSTYTAFRKYPRSASIRWTISGSLESGLYVKLWYNGSFDLWFQYLWFEY